MAANRVFAFAFAIALLMPEGVHAAQTVAPAPARIPKPPVAPVRPVVDDYFGTKVTDNYRWMETPHSEELVTWMKAQDTYTRAVLDSIPGRAKLLADIQKYDRAIPPVAPLPPYRMPGDLYLSTKVPSGGTVLKLYLRHGINGTDRLLVDPTAIKLATQGEGADALIGFAPSGNGKYIAVALEPGGDELHGELHVFDVATGRETGDVISPVGAEAWQVYWLPDNRSFVYGRIQRLPPGAPAAEVRQKFRAYLHVLGTDPAKDRPVFGYGVVSGIPVDPSRIASVEVQPGSRYALGLIKGSVAPNASYYIEPVADLGKTDSAWRKLVDAADGVTHVVVHGDDLYLLTYKNALNYKVIRTDARHPDLGTAEMVVPPSRAVVVSIHAAQDALYVQLLDGGMGRVLRVSYGPHPQTEEVPLPFPGSVFVHTNPRVPGALLDMISWTRAFSIYAYDPATRQVTETTLQPASAYGEPADIESVEVMVKSHDGTLVPLSIVYPKGIRLDGSNPTLLDGYGAYGMTLPHYLIPELLAWYGEGGVYAWCHVRGGGEYGEAWHLAGKGPTKPNTWHDFIACAQYLIQHHYTSPARLAGSGTSAGGILIGRAITSRPDLFAAALDWVGVSDTLRFETTQNGETNIPEFGSVKTKAGFKALYAMSPYAHVEDGARYPAVLLMTGANDPRVDPWEMAKMAARLQAATSSGKPVLLRVNYAGGHNLLGGTRTQAEEVFADQYSFLLWQFGVPGFQPHQ